MKYGSIDRKLLNGFSKKDSNRISGKIEAALSLKSPWLNILENIYNTMKKSKKVIILKGFSPEYDQRSESIFFKQLKIGKHSISLDDIVGQNGIGNYKITVVYTPSKLNKKRKK